jgi:predicted glycogen debranching enzyme
MNLKFPEKESFIPEWIITNRLGGYALGSADLINRRKYHGLLISSSESLLRIHLVSSVEEKIGVDDYFLYLDSNRYGDITYPDGFSHLVKYRLRTYPAFLYGLPFPL